MNLHEYANHDAMDLVRLLNAGEVSAAEVQSLARAAIAEVNPQINAVIDGPWDEPLAYAEDGPFAGVPFVLKDLVAHAAGVPTRCGTRLAGDGIVFDYDTNLVSRFRQAGLAILGLTAVPELGFNPNTESVRTGSTRNPWDTSRSAGGSSGGTAALVASRALPVGHGNDGGGSIRIPAGYNGLVGLKPSRGRISDGPDVAEVLFGIATEFCLTRSMRDCAALLDAVAGAAPGDKFVIRDPERPFVEEVGSDPGRLRIALNTSSYSSSNPVEPEIAAAVQDVAKRLEGLGHDVEVAAPPLDFDELIDASMKVWSPYHAQAADAFSAMSGVPIGPDVLEHAMHNMIEHGRTVSAVEMNEGLLVYNKIARGVGSFFSDYDLLLTPTTSTTALPLGELNSNDPSLDAEGWTRKILTAACTFTFMFNVSGTPAVSLPLATSDSGMPIGVQLAAPMCGEATLLRVGAALEEAMPWAARTPKVHVSGLAENLAPS
jgi:amidase